MKVKYLLMITLSCLLITACKNDEPTIEENVATPNSALVEQLQGLIDGLGTIIESKTLEDGSIVMKDDKGNTITKDKDGNFTIVTKAGETIYVDSSIKEDTSAQKDKWCNTKWHSSYLQGVGPQPDLNYPKKQFVQTLKEYGFTVTEKNINKDSTVVEVDQTDDYELHFKTIVASLKQTSLKTEYTYNRTYQYKQYNVMQNTIGDGDIRYRFEIKYGYDELAGYSYYGAYLYRDYYDFDGESFVFAYSEPMDDINLENDNAIIVYEDYDNKSTAEKVLSHKIQTTFYNYRRISDTQIAASNKTASYLLKDIDGSTPELEAYDLDGNKLVTFELVAL